MLLFLIHSESSAQLRPLDPIDWDALTSDRPIRISARVGWYDRQRVSLAGTSGRLIELGEVAVSIRVGDVVLEFAGTPQRLFRDKERFAPATGDAREQFGNRHDSGDYRVATIVPLNSLESSGIAVLRFGARLPTTDNLVGLDRDQTDFFALLGGSWRSTQNDRADGLRFGAEAGLSINGTRNPRYEQSDVLVYSGSAQRDFGGFALELEVTGQEDLKARQIRGNEDLGEARAGIRFGGTRWLKASGVIGYREFSPRVGLQVGGGVAVAR